MIWAVWLLGSLLVVAIVTACRFYGSIENLERQLDASKSRSKGLREEVGYWIAQANNYDRRFQAARNGLLAVRDLGTESMASIGVRMKRAATGALDNVYAIPFVKE